MLRKLIGRLLPAGQRVGSNLRGATESADRLIAAGNRAEEAGDLPTACERYRAATSAAPGYARAHLNLAIALEAAENPKGALECYEAALALDAADPHVNFNLGRLLSSHAQPERAERLLRAALRSKPAFPEANVVLSGLYESQENLAAAAAELESALKHRPQYAGALLNYASVLKKLGRLHEAESALRRAAIAEPNNLDAVLSLGSLLLAQGRRAEAIEFYEKAAALRPGRAEGQWTVGNILADEGRLDEAALRYRSALSLEPDFVEARHSLCMLLHEQDRSADAVACLRELLASHAGFANAYLSLARVLVSQGRLDEAKESLQGALALDPGLADAHLGLAGIHAARGEMDEAARRYEKALSIEPEHASARWSAVMSRLQPVYETEAAAIESRAAFSRELDGLDRWVGETRLAQCIAAVGEPPPFYLAYHEENNRELLQRHGRLCSRITAAWHKGQVLPAPARTRGRERIRVGVVSAHFRNHSVWNALVKGWFEQMDRTRFELEALYLGSDYDEATRLAQSRATHFAWKNASLSRWVQAIAARQPDILIYPDGIMNALSVKLASLRLAPVQIASWGHPETTGLPTIDHFLSAQDMEPEGAQAHYSEELCLLPHLGCSYRSRQIAPASPNLGDSELGSAIPALICPGTPFKYAPRHDAVFAQIARRLGDCRFVFFRYRVPELSAKLRQRLRASFAAYGLDADRFCLFAPWQSPAQFRGLMERAHVFLDTIGFSGFNTAMEAVECGLPVVTLEGRFMRGRFASGILKRIGLQELVARTEDDYIDLAVRISQDSAYRAYLRKRIESRRSILFDDPAPIRALEEFLLRAATPRRPAS